MTATTPPRLTLTLPEPPSANRYWRQARGHLYISKEAKDYKSTVRATLYQLGYTGKTVPFPAGTPVTVTVDWYRGIRAGDLDNRLKVSLDALRGILFDDDKQVVRIIATRYDRPKDGRLEVIIERYMVSPYLDA